MYYRITNAIKKIIIRELKTLYKDHPLFGENLSISNKFQHKERPKYAIVIKSATGNSLKLSLDNHKGVFKSYTTLANLKNQPGRMIEWVKEDVENICNLVKPGFYVVKMIEDNKFIVEPYLTVADEQLEIKHYGFDKAYLKNQNINPDSENIFAETGIMLRKDDQYTIDYNNGEITFLKPIDQFGQLIIDYQYIGEQTGPFEIAPETANNTAIPGVILAFGNFLKKDGVQVVVVYPERQEVAQTYGGKWLLKLDLSAYAQDTDTQEQLVDMTAMFLWNVLQEKLVNDGIYIDNFTISGESEEEEEQASNELVYLGGISFDAEIEWEAQKPILGVIKNIFLSRVPDYGQYDLVEQEIRNNRPVSTMQRGVDYKLGLQPVESFEPFLIRPVQKYTLYVP